jgi:hypothetical protein
VVCPAPAVKDDATNHCYVEEGSGMVKWSTGSWSCPAHYHHGTIDTQEEFDFVTKNLSSGVLWTDGKYSNNQIDWQTANEPASMFFQWLPGNPTNSASNNCVSVKVGAMPGFATESCNNKHSVLCELNPPGK